MASTDETMISCGVNQLYDLYDTPEKILHQVISASSIQDDTGMSFPAFYVFSDNFEEEEEGTKLARYITRHKLGAVVATRKRRNPNTHNLIQVWVWAPREKALRSWARKHGWATKSFRDGWDDYPKTRWVHNEY